MEFMCFFYGLEKPGISMQGLFVSLINYKGPTITVGPCTKRERSMVRYAVEY